MWMVGSARLEAVLHLAECGIAVVPAHHPVAVIGEGLTGCSCGRQSCPAVGRLGRGELVLLPPSVQPGGRGLVWLRAPEPEVALPDGERLFAALKALPPPDALAAWVQEQSGSLAVR